MMKMEEAQETFTEIIVCYNTNDWLKSSGAYRQQPPVDWQLKLRAFLRNAKRHTQRVVLWGCMRAECWNMDAIDQVHPNAFGCNKAHRLAQGICRDESVLHVIPIRHMQCMQKTDPKDFHSHIGSWEDNENTGHVMYQYATWWWAEAVGNIMLVVNAIWPDAEWKAKKSNVLVNVQCPPQVFKRYSKRWSTKYVRTT